jgi:hypothetical protein
MKSEFWLIKTRDEIEERIEFFKKFLDEEWDWSYPVKWKVSRYTSARSVSQNNLFHMWCAEMATAFTERGYQVNEEEMKMLIKYKFLGTEDVFIGNTEIPAQVRATRKLSPGEMMDFMDQIQSWALDHGVYLTCPSDSEFMKLKGG